MVSVAYSTLISVAMLRSLIDSGAPVTIIDASYNIPGAPGGDPLEDHFRRRIPGAKFFEVDEIANKSTGLPHMMPTDFIFSDFMMRLRVKNDKNPLVIYDRLGSISSPRVWYTFKLFGKENVAVLDGGLPKWIEEGNPLESGKYDIYHDAKEENPEDYNFKLDESKVKDLEEMKKISNLILESQEKAKFQILDARTYGRFCGARGT